MVSNVIVAGLLLPFVMCQTTQFDQECHILQTLDDLRNEVATLKSARASDQTEIANLKSSLANVEAQMINLRNSFTSTETRVTNLRSTLASVEKQISEQATEIATIQDSLAGVSTKPNVLFHVTGVSPQPTVDSTIIFKTVLENVGGGYNTTSGCFTAPARGAYWFTAELCAVTERFIYPEIYIRNTFITNVFIRDADNPTCSSLSAISVLEVGDQVCLKSGSLQNTDPLWLSSNLNNFLGAMIN